MTNPFVNPWAPVNPVPVVVPAPPPPVVGYVPEFDNTVTLTFNGNPAFPEVTYINQNYCLTVGSAHALASLHSPLPTVVLDAPFTAYGYTYNHLVPFLRFANGVYVNAGMHAQFWLYPGITSDQALVLAQAWVAQAKA